MPFRSLALGAVLVLAVAACGGAATTSSTPADAPSTAPSRAVDPTVAPSSAPASAAPGASSSPAITVPHGATGLEATLPSTFQGTPLFTLSFGAADLTASAAGTAVTSIVEKAGGDGSQATLAIANDPPSGTFNLVALSGPGSDGHALVEAYAAGAIDRGDSLSAAKTTLGGRDVTRVVSAPTNTLGDIWVYAVDDVLYGVQTKDEALAAELIALMP